MLWLGAREDFVLARPRTFTHVCFWWVPPGLRGSMSSGDPASMGEGARGRLHALAPRIKDAMQRSGEALIGYQPIDDLPNAWRMLFNNPDVTWDHAVAMAELIARLGASLDASD